MRFGQFQQLRSRVLCDVAPGFRDWNTKLVSEPTYQSFSHDTHERRVSGAVLPALFAFIQCDSPFVQLFMAILA